MKKHVWLTHRETDPDGYERDNEKDHSWWNEPDEFRFESGYHNGPKCKACGISFCIHCTTERYDEECYG